MNINLTNELTASRLLNEQIKELNANVTAELTASRQLNENLTQQLEASIQLNAQLTHQMAALNQTLNTLDNQVQLNGNQITNLNDKRTGKTAHTLSEEIGSLGRRRTRSSGSMLIRQLTEPQLLTCSRTVNSASIPVQ